MEVTHFLVGLAASFSFLIAWLTGRTLRAVLPPAILASLPLSILILMAGERDWAVFVFLLAFFMVGTLCAMAAWLGVRFGWLVAYLRRTPEQQALLKAHRAPWRLRVFVRNFLRWLADVLLGTMITASGGYVLISLVLAGSILIGRLSPGNYLGLEFRVTAWPMFVGVQVVCLAVLSASVLLHNKLRASGRPWRPMHEEGAA